MVLGQSGVFAVSEGPGCLPSGACFGIVISSFVARMCFGGVGGGLWGGGRSLYGKDLPDFRLEDWLGGLLSGSSWVEVPGLGVCHPRVVLIWVMCGGFGDFDFSAQNGSTEPWLFLLPFLARGTEFRGFLHSICGGAARG